MMTCMWTSRISAAPLRLLRQQRCSPHICSHARRQRLAAGRLCGAVASSEYRPHRRCCPPCCQQGCRRGQAQGQGRGRGQAQEAGLPQSMKTALYLRQFPGVAPGLQHGWPHPTSVWRSCQQARGAHGQRPALRLPTFPSPSPGSALTAQATCRPFPRIANKGHAPAAGAGKGVPTVGPLAPPLRLRAALATALPPQAQHRARPQRGHGDRRRLCPLPCWPEECGARG